ncbi:MAG: ANTAR domain-containing response regulator [Cellulosilyticaceae bacterium]
MNWANVLIVGTKSKALQDIGNFMYKQGFAAVSYAFSAGEARRMLSMRQVHMVVMSMPLQDDPRLQVIEDMKDRSEAFMVMIAKEETIQLIYAQLEDLRGIVLQKPLNPAVFARTVQFMKILIEKDYANYLVATRSKTEIMVSYSQKAKNLLIEQLGMPEPQAHRYLQKMAMNVRLPKEDLAQLVVAIYGE